YNESYKWGFNDDNRLFMVCKELDKSNIKFGMSNVIINKGLENKNLIDFCSKNDFKVYSPNNFQYHACGKENNKQQEVYICNYEVKNNNHSFNLLN
ncbi:hypothetical protein LO888_001798, partial [Campylobacter coli]|nr:hypothetical protein [Campylobacter coli]